MSHNTHFIQGQVLSHHLKLPEIGAQTFIAPTATVIGEVRIGEKSSVWFGSVIRGDVHKIEIGSYTNIQDLSMCHVSYQKAALKIGSYVTVGHSCILHGCTVGDRVLIGMGSIVMDQVEIGDDCIIGAGSLVKEKTKIPAGTLALGRPAKVIRPLTKEELDYLKKSAQHYADLSTSYTGKSST